MIYYLIPDSTFNCTILNTKFSLPCRSLSFCNIFQEEKSTNTLEMEYGKGETNVSLEQESTTAKNSEVDTCDLVGANVKI